MNSGEQEKNNGENSQEGKNQKSGISSDGGGQTSGGLSSGYGKSQIKENTDLSSGGSGKRGAISKLPEDERKEWARRMRELKLEKKRAIERQSNTDRIKELITRDSGSSESVQGRGDSNRSDTSGNIPIPTNTGGGKQKFTSEWAELNEYVKTEAQKASFKDTLSQIVQGVIGSNFTKLEKKFLGKLAKLDEEDLDDIFEKKKKKVKFVQEEEDGNSRRTTSRRDREDPQPQTSKSQSKFKKKINVPEGFFEGFF